MKERSLINRCHATEVGVKSLYFEQTSRRKQNTLERFSPGCKVPVCCLVGHQNFHFLSAFFNYFHYFGVRDFFDIDFTNFNHSVAFSQTAFRSRSAVHKSFDEVTFKFKYYFFQLRRLNKLIITLKQ